MDGQMTSLMNAVVQLAITILVGVLGIATTRLTAYLEAKKQSLQQKDAIASTDYYMHAGINIVQDFVRLSNQTIVNELKEKSADGRLTKEEAEEVFNVTKANIMGGMSQNIQNAILQFHGDIDSFIRSQIESAVVREKSLLQPPQALPAIQSSVLMESDPPHVVEIEQ